MKKILVGTLLGLACWALSGETYSPEQAKKIDDFLYRIAQRQSYSLFLKKMDFSQDELNSYLNLIYIKKYTPEVASIRLDLAAKNRIKGWLKIELPEKKYSAVPEFFRHVEITFSGKIECANYRMRYLFETILINGTHFSPEVIDETYALAQLGVKDKRSIFDWFSFLPGIKGLNTGEKTVTFLY